MGWGGADGGGVAGGAGGEGTGTKGSGDGVGVGELSEGCRTGGGGWGAPDGDCSGVAVVGSVTGSCFGVPDGGSAGGSARRERLIREGATPSLVTRSCTGEDCWTPRFTTRREPLGAKGRPLAAKTAICSKGVPLTPSTKEWPAGMRMGNNRAPLAGTSADKS